MENPLEKRVGRMVGVEASMRRSPAAVSFLVEAMAQGQADWFHG
ncbi:MAG: hypothetical protein ACP5E5_02170 [Acidobacteriaceae bacterium]